MPGTSSSGRRSRRIEENRQNWRESIQIAKILARLEKVDQKIIEDHPRMDSAEVAALRLLCENQHRLLAKVLPDLRAIEHKGELATSVTVRFNP